MKTIPKIDNNSQNTRSTKIYINVLTTIKNKYISKKLLIFKFTLKFSFSNKQFIASKFEPYIV